MNVLSNQVNVISTVTTQMVAITAAANRDSNLTRTSERVKVCTRNKFVECGYMYLLCLAVRFYRFDFISIAELFACNNDFEI